MAATAAAAVFELLATGETVRKRQAGTMDTLTSPEVYIARLVRDARTNPENRRPVVPSPCRRRLVLVRSGPADVAALAVHIMTNTALTGATLRHRRRRAADLMNDLLKLAVEGSQRWPRQPGQAAALADGQQPPGAGGGEELL